MEQQLFIQAILDNPDDDMLRLIYADWLEERGDPLGEFIRVQCELATLRAPQRRHGMYGNPPPQVKNRRQTQRFRDLSAGQMKLLMTHCQEWVKPLLCKAAGVIFERGCIEGINTTSADFLENAEVWYRTMPIRQLRMDHDSWQPVPQSDESFAEVLGSPWLANLRTLEARPTDHELRLLASSPNVAGLEELFIATPDDDTVEALLSSPHLRKLRTLGPFQQLRARWRDAYQARFEWHPY